jgi:hypothetical protein
MSTMKNHLCSFLSRLVLPGLVALLILLSPAFLRADAIITFDVSGFAANASGGTLDSCAADVSCAFSGMFQVDTTTGTVESSGLDITLPGLPTFNLLSGSFPSVLFSVPVGTIIASGPADTMSLIFITEPTPSSLVGFTGGGIFSTTQDTLANYTTLVAGVKPPPEFDPLA